MRSNSADGQAENSAKWKALCRCAQSSSRTTATLPSFFSTRPNRWKAPRTFASHASSPYSIASASASLSSKQRRRLISRKSCTDNPVTRKPLFSLASTTPSWASRLSASRMGELLNPYDLDSSATLSFSPGASSQQMIDFFICCNATSISDPPCVFSMEFSAQILH
ncbi:hypothetical protein D3C87_1533380 [compost metagenome]